MLRFGLIVLLLLTLGTPTLAEQSDKETPPPLSIETLYHPKQRFKYVESTTPATRWVTDHDGRSILLVRRDSGWAGVDPQAESGPADETETMWPGQETLAEQLVSLGDVDDKKAKQVVSDWIASGRSLDSALLKINGSIAIAGLKQTPRWVSRQASAWNDPTLSPDGTRVAFVLDHDLHVMDTQTGRQVRVTNDGSATLSNGRLDWVYQEEIYGRGVFKAFWWADDSRSLAFLKIENSGVRTFTFTTSDSPRGGTVVERYPKAGDPNPIAELWVATLDKFPDGQPSLKPVFQPSRDNPDDQALIVRVGWRPSSSELVFAHTSRVQDELTLWRYDVARAGAPIAIVKEKSDQWLEILKLPHWLPDGDFLWLSDLPSGRRRVWRMSEDGSRRMPLTPDNFDVRELVAVDHQNSVAWITGDRERGTVGQHLYRISLAGRQAANESLVQITGELPWHQVSICKNHQWYVDRASSLTQPTILSLASLKTDGGNHNGTPDNRPTTPSDPSPVDRPVDRPSDLPWELHRESLRLPAPAVEPLWVTVPTADGLELPAYLFPPIGARLDAPQDDDGAPRFPVLLEVYGGPLAPTVRDSWSASRYLFHQFLAQQGIGVMVVDNRSSGGRGLADAWSIHQRVGELETQDMVAAADWLKSQAWVDGDRIGIRGWSFGGFLTLHAMTHSTAFSLGIAGGSVTDWRNYDSVYTERYMGLPAKNRSGYESTSPLKAAAQLQGRVLLLHGEVDDNVHLANTLQMAAALQDAGKKFDMMIYPGSAHGVRPGMPTYHLMTTTWDFLERQWK